MLSSRKEGMNASLIAVSLCSTCVLLSNGIRNADTDRRTSATMVSTLNAHVYKLRNFIRTTF